MQSLHKSKEETLIHQMQMRAQEEASDDVGGDNFDDSSTVASHDSLDLDNDLSGDEHDADFSTEVEEAINNPVEFGLDFYSQEGLDACRDNGYLDTPSLQASQSISDDVYSFGLSLSDLQTQTKLLSNAAAAAHSRQQTTTIGDATQASSPHVFLTDGTHNEPAIMGIVHRFTLNTAQERAFHIIAYHTLGRSKVGPQLRMGVFGVHNKCWITQYHQRHD